MLHASKARHGCDWLNLTSLTCTNFGFAEVDEHNFSSVQKAMRAPTWRIGHRWSEGIKLSGRIIRDGPSATYTANRLAQLLTSTKLDPSRPRKVKEERVEHLVMQSACTSSIQTRQGSGQNCAKWTLDFLPRVRLWIGNVRINSDSTSMQFHVPREFAFASFEILALLTSSSHWCANKSTIAIGRTYFIATEHHDKPIMRRII